MSSTPLSFESLDGLLLEGSLATPRDPRGSLVLCHPHPQMGGTMTAPLLLALEAELVRSSWEVLRFNFRGIGASEGESSTGEAETEDAAGALDVVRERRPGAPVAIAGWSFGAGVAVRVAAHDEALDACVAIAPPVETKQGITEGLPAPNALPGTAPLLVVCGANDQVVSPAACRAWTEAAPGADYVEINGANHFFWAKYKVLSRTITEWLESALPFGAGSRGS